MIYLMYKKHKINVYFIKSRVDFAQEIDFTVNQSKPKKLILSFEHVGFMDSAGIGLIIGRYKLMESLGGELVVSHLSPKMEQIVSLSGVGKLAKIEKGETNDDEANE